MLSLYSARSVSIVNKCHFSFGFAKAYEDLGQFEFTCRSYAEGNSFRKQFLNHNISPDVQLFAQLKNAYLQIFEDELALNSGKLQEYRFLFSDSLVLELL